MPVALDTMGGDLGFEVQVEGAVAAAREFNIRSILVGPAELLKSKIKGLGAESLNLEICDAPDVITMDDTPVKAVRRKPDSSLCVAYELVNNDRASAILSSGNSGAMMAAGKLLVGLLPGIERPAIATLIPSAGEARPSVIMDAGANVDCDAQHLVQFAIMGTVYSSCLFSLEKPKVSLLSNGTEPSKGTDIIRQAANLLQQMSNLNYLGLNYIGYVEGRDVATGKADVIICDGFVGNVLLKSMEGCVRLVFDQILHDSKKSFLGMLGLALSKGIYKNIFKEKFDYTAYGGAPLLGLRKLAIVLHGSSGARAVKNAIKIANSFAEMKMVEKIASSLAQIEEQLPEADDMGVYAGLFAKSGVLNKDHLSREHKSKRKSRENSDSSVSTTEES